MQMRPVSHRTVTYMTVTYAHTTVLSQWKVDWCGAVSCMPTRLRGSDGQLAKEETDYIRYDTIRLAAAKWLSCDWNHVGCNCKALIILWVCGKVQTKPRNCENETGTQLRINKYQLSLNDPRDGIVLRTDLDDHCDKLQRSSVGAQRCWPTTVQIIIITLWACRVLQLRIGSPHSTSEVFVHWYRLPSDLS